MRTVVSALTATFLLWNPSASIRSWQGLAQSTLTRPLESVRPSSAPEACLTDAPEIAAPALSSTVMVKEVAARALTGAGIASTAKRASAPNSALDSNDRIRPAWEFFVRRSEQFPDSARHPGRWIVRC